MISNIRTAAENVGIEAFISNSREKIETQLNRVTSNGDLPTMLVSWDLETQLNIQSNGFLGNPSTKVVLLLMRKSDTRNKGDHEAAAEEMGLLFQTFVKELNTLLVPFNLSGEPSLSGISYTLVPMHGAGKHSGVIGTFNMLSEISNC